MHHHADGVTVYIWNDFLFFVFLCIPWVLSSLQQIIISAWCHLFCITFSSTLYLCFCTFFCSCSLKIFLTENFSLLWVSHTDNQTDTYLCLQSKPTYHNEHEDCCYQKEWISHFNARLWGRACLVVLAVKGSYRLGYSVNKRPLMSLINC